MESCDTSKLLTPSEKSNILVSLTKSQIFDHFMTKKFPQFKRYGRKFFSFVSAVKHLLLSLSLSLFPLLGLS